MRRTVRVASVASAALVAGLLSGSGSRADEQPPALVELAYECALPAAANADASPDPSQDTTATGADTTKAAAKLAATVKVTTRLPTTAVTGQPIEAGPVQVETALPRAELADRLPAGDELASEATLAVEVRQNGEKAAATWSGLSGRADMPADGTDLALPHTGDVPSITVGSPGEIELIAGDLTLTVTPASGTPVTATCSPAQGADRGLAKVAVPDEQGTEPEQSPSQDASPDEGSEQPRDGVTVNPGDEPKVAPEVTCGPKPTGDLDTSQAPPPPVPPDVSQLPGFQACAYAVGLATVRKQNGSMVINDPSATPALMDVAANVQVGSATDPVTGENWSRFDSLGRLVLPEADSTFLGFGFMPVSARVAFDTGPITISTGDTRTLGGSFAVATFFQTLRIRSVKVNGTTLPVGPDCRTEKAFRVTLRGTINDDGSGSYTNVLAGGLLTGKVDIPAFTGCGTGGENLNRLFTAAISGPDNLIAMNQAPVCSPELQFGCPPVVPPLPPIKLSAP
ncbi:DUF6801 domain-containing protein [Streptomyces sp. SGAir0957]